MKYFLAALLFLFVVALSLGFWYGYQVYYNPDPAKMLIHFSITSKEPASSVISRLKLVNLIRSEIALKVYLRLNNLNQKLKPGGYQISRGITPKQVIDELVKGPKDVWVTIPEGWRREQIAARLSSLLSGRDSSFSAVEFIRDTATLEGQLFPDTYLISPQTTASDVIKKMTANFTSKTHLADKDVLIIASLVEREAKSDSDRAVIAGILTKRYAAGWPLQVDASVQYALDSYNCKDRLLDCSWWQPLSDTGFKSVYNTYLHPGLPPSPISNPGLGSITAASDQNNAKTPYWYYLHDTLGIAHFARNLSEHQLNIDKYLHP